MSREHGSKPGVGGLRSDGQSNVERRKRLRQLALENVNLEQDPYFLKNHIGLFECRLCLTLHLNEGSYLTHTQGKKHQNNLKKRAFLQAKKSGMVRLPKKKNKKIIPKRPTIGRPGFEVIPQIDSQTKEKSILFKIEYPKIEKDVKPLYRIMSAFEQKVEIPDERYQYLAFAAMPYENIAFRIPNEEIDRSRNKFWSKWNTKTNIFSMKITFKIKKQNTIQIFNRNQNSLKSVVQQNQNQN
ncbi:splicing factor 3a subunit [Anaeramoeba flamelloides]|uniref:Splicing factor 3a subunit n=1 Tax=Anaeramoeba flamelloides TaxID=1746091 RepID=A0AAV8A986_9EUKA|nr:splicing factor 3a subunit [Anaeramoeba flamelloides]